MLIEKTDLSLCGYIIGAPGNLCWYMLFVMSIVPWCWFSVKNWAMNCRNSGPNYIIENKPVARFWVSNPQGCLINQVLLANKAMHNSQLKHSEKYYTHAFILIPYLHAYVSRSRQLCRWDLSQINLFWWMTILKAEIRLWECFSWQGSIQGLASVINVVKG